MFDRLRRIFRRDLEEHLVVDVDGVFPFRGSVPRQHDHLTFFVDGKKIGAGVTHVEWVIDGGVSSARIYVRRKGKQWQNQQPIKLLPWPTTPKK